jgi:hypothetical protein
MYNFEGYVLLIRYFRVICTVQSLFHAHLVRYFYTHAPSASLMLSAKSHKVMTKHQNSAWKSHKLMTFFKTQHESHKVRTNNKFVFN